MLTISSGTVSSKPFTWNFQTFVVASMSSVLKIPLPEIIHAFFVLKGSNSTHPAQCMDDPSTQLTPFGSRSNPLATRSIHVAPPLVVRNILSPHELSWD